MATELGEPLQPKLHGATLESCDGKWVCTLQDEHGALLRFILSETPTARMVKDPKADNTHVDLTLTMRVENIATITNQTDLI